MGSPKARGRGRRRGKGFFPGPVGPGIAMSLGRKIMSGVPSICLLYTSPDGAGSEEFGTEPDIPSPESESPLETCLKAIG